VERKDGGFIMKTRKKIWFIGIVLLLTAGSALAHDPTGHGYYPDDRWSGAVTIYGGSHGYAGWSGTLNYGYGVNYGYAPGYVPWAAVNDHRHGPRCRHATGHRYGKAYRKGYHHGRNHSRRAGHRHGHHH
jgi:hypothetical protein